MLGWNMVVIIANCFRHDQDDKENIDVPAPKRAKLSESEYASTSMTKSSVWFAPVNEDIMVSSNWEPLVESVSVSITTTFQQPLQPSPKTVSSKSPESDTAFSFS